MNAKNPNVLSDAPRQFKYYHFNKYAIKETKVHKCQQVKN